MANNCYYEMKVKGNKEDCNRLFKILNYEDNEYYLARIFSVDIIDEEDDRITLCGDCAWSVYTCMCEGSVGTYKKFDEEVRDDKGRLMTTIAYLSDILNLEIEVISDEPGMGFSEHLCYKNGEEIVNDCEDYPPEEVMYPDLGDRDVWEYLEETGQDCYSGINNLVFFEYL